MPKLKEFSSFVLEASRTSYAYGDKTKDIKERDGSTTNLYVNGNWSFHDNYFGGEPYGGREVIFYKKKPYWIMVYFGTVSPKYDELKNSLHISTESAATQYSHFFLSRTQIIQKWSSFVFFQ